MAKKDYSDSSEDQIKVSEFSSIVTAYLHVSSDPYRKVIKDQEAKGATYDEAATVKLRQKVHAEGKTSGDYYIFFT